MSFQKFQDIYNKTNKMKKEKQKTKVCGKCHIEKLTTEFNRKGNNYQSYCKVCSNKYSKNQKYLIKIANDYVPEVPQQPYTYNSNREKEMVHQLMKKMNWQWCEETQRFYKDGIVNQYGEWLFLKNKK